MYTPAHVRKSLVVLAATFLPATASAQLNGDGYYRVQNYTTGRYITVIDDYGTIDFFTTDADLGAIATVKPFETIVSDPGSIIYIKSMGDTYYDLQGQGTGMFDIVGGYIQIGKPLVAGCYEPYATKAGQVAYLYDQQNTKDVGKVLTAGRPMWRYWYIHPVNTAGDHYFGIAPSVSADGLYAQTFYASFGLQTSAAEHIRAYVVKRVVDDVAIYEELSGDVPAETPVILTSTLPSASDNRLQLLHTDAAAPTGNKLKGVYFCNDVKTNNPHRNVVAYKPATMRLLGTTSDGHLGFVTADVDYVPANSAYLTVAKSAPAELRLMTESEYDAYIAAKAEEERRRTPVTLSAISVSRQYGTSNPDFTFATEGTILSGQPTITCAATEASPVGTYPITIARGTVENENLTLVDGTLTVTAAPLTVTARSYSRRQGEANPAFEVDYSGFLLTDDATVLTSQPVVTTAATAASAPGTYPIEVSSAAAHDYAISYVAGTLTVTEAERVDIVATDVTVEYGDPIPALTYTSTGAALSGQPALSTTAIQGSPVGTYAITVSKGTVANYNDHYTAATLTITPAPLTIAVSDATRTDEEPDPEFEIVYEGFKLTDDASVLTQPAVAATEATATSAPGQYAITVGGAEAVNYAISYRAGTLTVTEAPAVAIAATDITVEYGEPLPALTYTTAGATLRGEPELVCDAVVGSPVGTYAIHVVPGTVANLHATYADATLTITPAPLTIGVCDATRTEGDPNPVFELTYEGFKLTDDASVLTQPAVASTEATATSAPGQYAISIGGAEAVNYAISYRAGTLTVLEAEGILIAATSLTVEYGEPLPALAYTTAGATLSGEPELVCDAVVGSPAGTYAIRVLQGTVTNLHATYADATLTITPAPLTVTACSYSREEHQDNPELEVTYEGFKLTDDASVLLALPVAATDATAESPAGDYVISVSGGESDRYSFVYVSGTLTVNPYNAVSGLAADGLWPADVYTVAGRLARRGARSLAGLPAGVYVVGGRKVIVR